MAFQTTTISETASADATSSSSSSSSSSSNTSNRSLGNSSSSNTSTFPLVPAFLISGLLLMAIITIYVWRRRLSPNGTFSPLIGSGVGAPRFMLDARTGAFGAFGAAPWEGSGSERAVGARAARKEKDFGPKPEMWDAYLGVKDLRKSRAKRDLRWMDMKPVAVSEVVEYRPAKSDDSKARDTIPIPIVSRPFWRRTLKDTQTPLRTEEGSGLTGGALALKSIRFDVTFVIMMPAPAEDVEDRTSTSQRQHERLDEYDLVLGTSSTCVSS